MRTAGQRSALGDPVERGIPVVPLRWRRPALLGVIGFCVLVFLAAIVFGLSHG